MSKYIVFSLFILLSCGLSAQTFSFKDSADVADFAKWTQQLKSFGKDGKITNALEESARSNSEENALLKAVKANKKYADLQGEALKVQLAKDLNELDYALFVASNEYKARADKYNKDKSNPSSARNAYRFSQLAKEYWADMDYFKSFFKEIQTKGVDSYDVATLRMAGGLLDVMVFSLNKKSDKLYKESKAEFASLTKNAGINCTEK